MSVKNFLTQVSFTTIFTFFTYVLLLNSLDFDFVSLSGPASCLPTDCFCEFIKAEIPKQRSNALSSLAFVIVSAWIMLASVFSNTSKISETKIDSFSMVYSVSVFSIGVGSFIYHATLTFIGQFLDVAGMNALANLILLIHYRFAFKIHRTKFALIYITLNLIACYLIWHYPELRRISFAFLLLIALLLIPFFKQSRKFSNQRYLYLAIFIQVCAYILWIIDIRKIYCAEFSLIQGHALWHILSAGVCFILFQFYKRNDFARK